MRDGLYVLYFLKVVFFMEGNDRRCVHKDLAYDDDDDVFQWYLFL